MTESDRNKGKWQKVEESGKKWKKVGEKEWKSMTVKVKRNLKKLQNVTVSEKYDGVKNCGIKQKKLIDKNWQKEIESE